MSGTTAKKPKVLRLSRDEEEQLRLKCIEINKILIRNGHEPVKDSELAHKILKETIRLAYAMADGTIKIGHE